MSGDGPKLSQQQTRPLAVENASVALSAGAGCGKTTVLTARFLGDLEATSPRPLSSIVALTFTEKAARELRQRIRSECRRKLATGDDPTRWRSVLRGLEAAPIGTFHEFCGQWLRRHAIEAGIDPDFVILDASVSGAIRDESLARCLRQWLAAQDPDLIELAVELGLGRVRQGIADLLTTAPSDQLLSWKDRTPAEVVACWHEVWQHQGRRLLSRTLAQAARPCLDLLLRHEGVHPLMRVRRAFLLASLPELEARCDEREWLQEVRDHAMIRGAGSKAHWASPEIYDAVNASFKALRNAIDRFCERSVWDDAATLEAAEQGLRLVHLTARARLAYDAAKRARGGLDFDDLLNLTLQRLRVAQGRSSTTPDPWGESIARLLVDEFQDTDPIQSEILERLTTPEAMSGRLFLVGDFKQSIYRFRGARPEIFQQFRDRIPLAGRHDLTENYRSVPDVLRFVNALFASTFPESEPGLLPQIASHNQADQPAVEFVWPAETETGSALESEPESESDDSPTTTAGKLSAHQRRIREARALAHRLRERLDQGWQVRDRETNQVRQAHAGDLVLLFRAMTDVGPYESALAEVGFDYHTVGGGAFYVQQEVTDLINILSAIEDPFDPVALAGALRSPFFCLSDNGLFWLSTIRASLVDGLEHAHEVDELSDLDRQRARRARELLLRWRGFKDRESIAALVHRILDESGYEAALLGESLGARKRANARKLVRLARRFDQQRGLTLAAFVAKLRADLKRPPREEQASTTDESGTSVRLMSIHQAKGLEFPIVVLPDLNRRAPGRLESTAFQARLGPLVRPSREPSSGPVGLDPTPADPSRRQSLGWLCYQTLEQHEEDTESLRLFYVAATRARDALILSASVGAGESATSPALMLLDERFDRRTGRCRVDLPEGWSVPTIQVTSASASNPDNGRGQPARQLPLLEVATVIEQAVLNIDAPLVDLGWRPRFVELDAQGGPGSSKTRLDRLTRLALTHPEDRRSRDLAKLASRIARRHDPLLPRRILDALIARLKAWSRGPLADLLAGSVVESDREWTLAWPPEGPDATVFHGHIDLLCRGRRGHAQVVSFCASRESTCRERLRLLLSLQAAESLGLGPIEQGWWFSPDQGEGGWCRETRFDRATIDNAARTYFHELAGNRR